MNRIKHLVFIILLSPLITQAQVQVKEEVVKMGSEPLSAYIVTYKYAKQYVKGTMETKIKDASLRRSSRKKGFSIYRGVVWQDISPNKLDYYYKIKGNRKKGTLYFVASKGYNNYVTSASDSAMAGTITRFLQHMDNDIATYKQIKEKEADLKKIEKEKKKHEGSLDKVEKEQQKTRQEIEELKKKQ